MNRIAETTWGALLSACLLLSSPAATDAFNALPPEEYGRVIIDNYSRKAGLAPVVFEHWLHRSKFTCRLCHIDIGFAMEAGATGIKASDNAQGIYCGTCHNGVRLSEGRKIFPACAEKVPPGENGQCERCHSLGKKVKKEYDFTKFTGRFPKEGLRNRIDWEKAEEKKIIEPADFLEGSSFKKNKMKPQEDFSLKSRASWMTDIIFSHKKHAMWNGCEVCHPEIFPIKKEGIRFSMLDISDGRYCGACHDKVAFPLKDCERCHKGGVR